MKIERLFDTIWNVLFLPLLFVLIGSEVDFKKIDAEMIGMFV